MPLCNIRPVFKEIYSTTTFGLLWNPTIEKFHVKDNTTVVQAPDSTASRKGRW